MRRLEISDNKREASLRIADLACLPPGALMHICSKRSQSGCKVLFWQGLRAGWHGTDVKVAVNQKMWGSSASAGKPRWDKVASEGL